MTGLKEMQKQLRELKDSVASEQVAKLLGSAAHEWTKYAKANMRTQRWPHEVYDNTFVDSRWPQAKRGSRITALFGVAKRGKSKPWRAGYVEWAGGTKGMSLAAMFEFGTSKMSPRPACRPALSAWKSTGKGMIRFGLKKILDEAIARRGNG